MNSVILLLLSGLMSQILAEGRGLASSEDGSGGEDGEGILAVSLYVQDVN